MSFPPEVWVRIAGSLAAPLAGPYSDLGGRLRSSQPGSVPLFPAGTTPKDRKEIFRGYLALKKVAGLSKDTFLAVRLYLGLDPQPPPDWESGNIYQSRPEEEEVEEEEEEEQEEDLLKSCSGVTR